MNKKYTKACSNMIGNGTCPRAYCSFAHYIEDIVIVKCFNGDDCTYNGCRFLHNESIGDYYHRTGLSIPHLPSRAFIPIHRPETWITLIQEGLAKHITTFHFV